MRISDWSSDVCSSDLVGIDCRGARPRLELTAQEIEHSLACVGAVSERIEEAVDRRIESRRRIVRSQHLRQKLGRRQVGVQKRTEERSVGKEGVSRSQSRGTQYQYKNKYKDKNA